MLVSSGAFLCGEGAVTELSHSLDLQLILLGRLSEDTMFGAITQYLMHLYMDPICKRHSGPSQAEVGVTSIAGQNIFRVIKSLRL